MAEIDLTPKEEDNRLPTVFPSLVIGLGGTGVQSLRYLRRRLKDEFGSRIKDEPSLIQLLGVDTVPLENRSSVEALHQHEYAYIGGFNAEQVIKNLHRFPEIERWWDLDTQRGLPLGYISTGAKQLRMIGRLALYRRFHMYSSRLEAKLNRLAHIQAHREMHEAHRPTQDQLNLPHVFIVSSLAGGTGSGAFLDVACHLRARLQHQARIIGILVMPSVFEEDIPALLQQRRIKANSYAALKELEYFQSGHAFETVFPEQGPIRVEGGAFTHVYLIDRPNVSGFQVSKQSDIQQLIADFIFQVTVTPMAGKIWEMDANVSRERVDGKSLAYSALGYSSMIVDERARAEALWQSYATDIHIRLGGWDDDNDRQEVATAVDGVMVGIQNLAEAHREELLREGETPAGVYAAKMRALARKAVVDGIAAHLRHWGVIGVQRYIEQLTQACEVLQKNDAAAKGYRQAVEKATETRDKALAPKRANRILDFIGNRDSTEQERQAQKNAEAALREAQLEENGFLLMHEGAAPDLLLLLGQLRADMAKYEQGLNAMGEGLAAPAHPPLKSYALRTVLHLDDGQGAAQKGDAYWQTVKEAAAALSNQWAYLNSQQPDAAPVVALSHGGDDAARHEIVDQAHELMSRDAASRSSLFTVLYRMHKVAGGREDVQDLLRDFIRRCVPYVRLDFDRHNFSEKNIEPSYLLCLPNELLRDYSEQGSVFWALATGDYDFKATEKPNRPDRMDALCVSHGYPLSVFADLPLMFDEYISPDLGRSPLHLQCCWRRLMNQPIHTATQEQLDREASRQSLFDELCRDKCGDSSGQTKGDGRPPSPSSPPPSSPRGGRSFEEHGR